MISVPLRAQQVRRWTVGGFDTINSGPLGIFTWSSTTNNTVAPSITWLANSSLWADMAPMIDEYRIESVRVRGMPISRYNRAPTSAMGSLAIAYDADGLVGFNATSFQQVLSYSTSRVCAFYDPFEIAWNVPQVSAAVWYDANGITTPASTQQGELFFYTDGQTASGLGTIMTVVWELVVVTRGTRQ
jgi:hypothetical protein